MTEEAAVELVILTDDEGNSVGTAAKASVHHAHTPLHLAFSCYVFDRQGRLLVSQRALAKPTWPGAWTNSFCGHPSPGEAMREAVRRRAGQELGIDLVDLQLTLPQFRYEATMPNGVRENELCPVYTAITDDDPVPDAAEVEALEWVDWVRFRGDVLQGLREISPWCVQQVAELTEREISPGRFRPAPVEELPRAVQGNT
jgi:isopentenyl-diphosphate delta-isomerase